MTEHYKTTLASDEELVKTGFRRFVTLKGLHGESRTEAIFYFPHELVPQAAPYDVLRPIFRATGAVVAGIGLNPDGSFRVSVSANAPVRSRIEQIVAGGPHAPADVSPTR